MKRLIKFGSVGLAIAGAIAGGGEAFAQTVPAISQYSSTNQTTGVTTRFVRIVNTPRVQVPITIAGQPQTANRQVRLNACGQAILDATGVTQVSFNSGVVDSGNIAIPSLLASAAEPVPTCDTATGASSLINDPAGGLFNVTPVINIGGGRILINAGKLPTNQPRVIDVAVTRNQTRQRFVSTNACGIASINLGDSTSIPATATIAIGTGSPVTINSITNGGFVPITECAGSTPIVQSGFPTGTQFKNAAGDVFIGYTSATPLSVTLPTGSVTSRSVTSDRCGGITIGTVTNPQTTPFTLNGVSIEPDTIGTGLKPSCKLQTNGEYAYDVAPSAGVIKLSDGRIFVTSTTANPSGFGDRRIYTIATTATNAARNYTKDNCGVVRIRQTTPEFTSYELDGAGIGGAYNLADLPTREYVCRNINGVGSVGYASPAN